VSMVRSVRTDRHPPDRADEFGDRGSHPYRKPPSRGKFGACRRFTGIVRSHDPGHGSLSMKTLDLQVKNLLDLAFPGDQPLIARTFGVMAIEPDGHERVVIVARVGRSYHYLAAERTKAGWTVAEELL